MQEPTHSQLPEPGDLAKPGAAAQLPISSLSQLPESGS